MEPAKGSFFMVTAAIAFVLICAVWCVGTLVLEWEHTWIAVIAIGGFIGLLVLVGLLRIFIDKRELSLIEEPEKPRKNNGENI
jgi:branched-subunit amino acid ABC-type transport system permease component